MWLIPILLACFWRSEAVCRQWRCRPFPQGVCAEWSANFVYVNVDECPQGQTCSLLELVPLMNWYPSGQLKCAPSFLPHTSQPINCKNRDTLIALRSPHAQKCEGDSDCLLWNGGTGRCGCALDGNSYCKLSEGDHELDGFYSSCDVMTGLQAFSWYLLIDLGHMLPGPQWCVKKTFEEVPYLLSFLHKENLTSFLQVSKEFRGPD